MLGPCMQEINQRLLFFSMAALAFFAYRGHEEFRGMIIQGIIWYDCTHFVNGLMIPFYTKKEKTVEFRKVSTASSLCVLSVPIEP